MLSLIIAIIGSTLISVFIRLSKNYTNNEFSVLGFNYVVCTILSFFYSGFSSNSSAETGFSYTLIIGIINGVLYLASLILMQYNVKKNGVVLPVIYSKLSLIVPVLMSCVLFRESPTIAQIIGCVFSLIAIFLMNYEKGAGFAFNPALLTIFFIDGCVSALSKVYDETGNQKLSGQFLFFTFATALLLVIVLIILRKERPGLRDVLFGVAIGIPNFFASRFMLTALETVPGIIAYPMRGIGIIILITLIGLLIFREKLNRQKGIAIAIIAGVMVLLNL